MKHIIRLILFIGLCIINMNSAKAQRLANNCPSCQKLDFVFPDSVCKKQLIRFTNTSSSCFNSPAFRWSFGDGSTPSTTPSHTYALPGIYNVVLYFDSTSGCTGQAVTKQVTIFDCDPPPCINCIGSFAPESGDYILSAWVKEENALPTTLTYTKPEIYIQFPTDPNFGGFSSTPAGPFTAKGAIIDGWQRIESGFTIPSNATYINLQLKAVSGNCYFDDIRIFPVNGSMKSYVYDPVNLRLVAELDERNYATLYEYDEEGKLVRVKKETEKGIMTIKTANNSAKKKQ